MRHYNYLFSFTIKKKLTDNKKYIMPILDIYGKTLDLSLIK
jgi:hypothetical protein